MNCPPGELRNNLRMILGRRVGKVDKVAKAHNYKELVASLHFVYGLIISTVGMKEDAIKVFESCKKQRSELFGPEHEKVIECENMLKRLK